MANITLKGNPIHTNGNLPAANSQAPDFVLVDKDLQNRGLKDYAGKRKVLSIVPSLDTAVCAASARKFNEKMDAMPNTVVLVVSADLPFAQSRMCGAENLSSIIPLSTMRSKDFAKDYGVLIQDGPLAGICARAVIVLDENDKVLYTELVPEITQEPNYEEVLKRLSK
ncbi:MAG: thiol peroxidase [Chlamydiota bacterium]